MSDEQPAMAPGECVRERHEKLQEAGVGLSHERPWGLALSGGGIRSATFCFGVLKALAANKLFREFDLMSTVSGGGYIGSTVGKLFDEQRRRAEAEQAPPDPLRVEEALGGADTRLFAAWLRANGRYLIPGGAQDLLFAAASYGRNLFAVHFELALLSFLIGGGLIAIDLLAWQWGDGVFRAAAQSPSLAYELLGAIDWIPAVCLFLPVFLWLGALLASAFWAVPNDKARPWGWPRPIVTLIFFAALVTLVVSNAPFFLHGEIGDEHEGAMKWPLVASVAALLLAAVLGHLLAVALARMPHRDLDWARNRLTAWLSACLAAGLALVALGVVDYLAWMLATIDSAKQSTLGLLAVLIAVALRAILPKIADLPRGLTPGTRMGLLGVLNVVGLLLLAFVLVFWISIEHRAVSGVLFARGAERLEFALAWHWLGAMVVPPLLMVLLSSGNREFLNRSSLHGFYRARLTRSYLGAGNPARFHGLREGIADPLGSVRDAWPAFRVGQVHAGDDVPMQDYAPHAAGGPVHLVNVCVNQTADPRGGLFNQDRKGLLMTVGPRAGVRVGTDAWRPATEPLSLGAWVSISGAAVSPGLGSSTRPGVAALLMLAGVRLGYWWDSGELAGPDARRANKYGEFLDELRGRFDGVAQRDWFLSDGGHFENTAAYALLREECEVIVVADCGADPRYAFGDLENLVRKARIDLQAEITFLRRQVDGAAPAAFGSLNEIASSESEACIALARVDYRHSGKTGWMFVLKPNMCQGLPVDLVNFKADNPLFPQEPTTDQFFSEAQWESYFQLGASLARQLDLAQLGDAARFARENFVEDDGAVIRQDDEGRARVEPPRKRISSRIAATGAVSATIGIGSVASIAAAAWQAVNAELQNRTLASRIEPSAYRELTDIFGRLLAPPEGSGSAPRIQQDQLGEMATTLLRVGDAVCTRANTTAFHESSLMKLMIEHTKEACRASSPRHPSCDTLLNDDELPECLQSAPGVVCEPMYWGRDHGHGPLKPANCWKPPAVVAVPGKTAKPAPAASAPPGPSAGASAARPPTAGASSPRRLTYAVPAVKPPASAASAAGVPASAAVGPAAPGGVCKGYTVYIQIYGPELRDSVRLLREPWRAIGASVPPVEDVWDSARRAGRRLPQPYRAPTVLYRSAGSEQCAKALVPPGATVAWQVKPLRADLDDGSTVIEVWIPPTWDGPSK